MQELRQRNQSLEAELPEARKRAQRLSRSARAAHARAGAAEGPAGGGEAARASADRRQRRARALLPRQEVKILRHEREEMRRRIARLVEVLDGAGVAPAYNPGRRRRAWPTKLSSTSVHVEIFGQTYSVQAGGDPGYVEELAGLRRRADARGEPDGGAVDSVRIAVLAALNIADECFRLRAPGCSKADDERGQRARRPGPRAGRGPRGLTASSSRFPLAWARPAQLSSAVKVPCVVRDGLVNLEPTSFN